MSNLSIAEPKSNDLRIFENPTFGKIRITIINGNPYFCLLDICKILDINNISKCKERLKKDGVTTSEVIDSLGRKQNANFINESNLYKCIFQSRKPEAEKFQDWVTEEVIPSIRKYGMYAKEDILDNPNLLIDIANKIRNDKLRIRTLEKEVAIMREKAEFFDDFLSSKGLIATTVLAKNIGITTYKLNKFLKEMHVIYRRDNTWYLTDKYANKNLARNVTRTCFDSEDTTPRISVSLKWTPEGAKFVYDLYKKHIGEQMSFFKTKILNSEVE